MPNKKQVNQNGQNDGDTSETQPNNQPQKPNKQEEARNMGDVIAQDRIADDGVKQTP